MSPVLLTKALREQGFDGREIRHLVAGRQLDHVRRGVYAPAAGEQLTKTAAHRRLIDATLPVLRTDATFSHGSAAVLHGLPDWEPWLRRVQITRSGAPAGQIRRSLHVRVAPLEPDEITVIEGIPVTSLARTVLDLGRAFPFHQAVAAGDYAIRNGLDCSQLESGLERMYRWPRVRCARRVARFVDPKSESVGESVSRVRLADLGLPKPELQFKVTDERGRVLARCDFAWPEFRTVGEFDGRIKYGRALLPDQSIEEVVYREKLREDAIRDQGWQVVRWIWADLDRPQVIRDRIVRAFGRTSGNLRFHT